MFKNQYALLSENYEATARADLINELKLGKGENPSRAQMGEKLQQMFKAHFNKMAKKCFNSNDLKGNWVNLFRDSAATFFCLEPDQNLTWWLKNIA